MDVTVVVVLLLFWLMQLNPSDILHKSNTTGLLFFVITVSRPNSIISRQLRVKTEKKVRNKCCCWLTACHLLSQDIIKIPACRLAERSTLILLINYLEQNRIILLYSFLWESHKLIALLVRPYVLKGSQNSESGEIDMLVRSLPVWRT